MKKYWIVVLLAGLFTVQCSNKDTQQNGALIKIEGFIVTDALGNNLFIIGDPGNDWQILDWSQLSSVEQSFLNFPENINMSNTTVCSVNPPKAYPNPFFMSSNLRVQSTDSVKFKLAVVNSQGQVLKTQALKIKGNQDIALDFSNTSTFSSGLVLRYYFSYSAATQQNFKAGYGDVKVCNPPSPQGQCF